MDLRTYLDKTKTTTAAFARDIGVCRSAVYRWLNGSREPQPEQARRVVAATKGKVTMADQYSGYGKVTQPRPFGWRP